LIELIDSKYISTDAEYKPVDFGRKAQYFTLDVITTVAYGFPFGFLETDSDVYQYIETSEKVVPAAMVVTVFPWLNHILTSSFMERLLPSAADPVGFGKIIGFVPLLIIQWIVKRDHGNFLDIGSIMVMVDTAKLQADHRGPIPWGFYDST
jgi:hypothetical protein